MFEKMDKLYLDTQTKRKCFMNNLREEERGASDIVAIIAIIVIVLAVAVIFRKELGNLVTEAFSKVSTWLGDDVTQTEH